MTRVVYRGFFFRSILNFYRNRYDNVLCSKQNRSNCNKMTENTVEIVNISFNLGRFRINHANHDAHKYFLLGTTSSQALRVQLPQRIFLLHTCTD